jgi:hypothetical protein
VVLTSPRGLAMKSWLPPLYEKSRVMDAILEAEGAEFDLVRAALAEILDQFFLETATWGLGRWEREHGLPEAPLQPTAERREKISSRLRGTGTATIRVVKNVAEAFDAGAINVIEDYLARVITIQFADTKGVPPNLQDLKDAVRAVLQAHLNVLYDFNYLTHDNWDALARTWDQTDALALSWDAFEVYG